MTEKDVHIVTDLATGLVGGKTIKDHQNTNQKREDILSQMIRNESVDILSGRLKTNKTIHNYQVCKTIGSGAFGTVRLCKLLDKVRKTDHDEPRNDVEPDKERYVAIKQIYKHRQRTNMINIYMEILTQGYLAHPGIVRCHEWFEDDNNLYIVMDYVKGSNLYELQTSYPNNQLPFDKAKSYARQLIGVLLHLKKHNVVHRDVKPENILIDTDDNLYLCDFGFAIVLQPESPYRRDSAAVGSPDYVSPEVIKLENHDYSTDMWAVGVILFEITYNKQPYYAETAHETYYKILHKTVDTLLLPYERNHGFNKYSSSQYLIDLHTLIRRLLITDPQKRLKVEDCYKENYFINGTG